MDKSGGVGVVVQCPHRGPAAVAIAHPPGRQAFGVGASAAAQDLGGHPEQAQAFVGALDGAFVIAGVAFELGVGGSAAPSGAPITIRVDLAMPPLHISGRTRW